MHLLRTRPRGDPPGAGLPSPAGPELVVRLVYRWRGGVLAFAGLLTLLTSGACHRGDDGTPPPDGAAIPAGTEASTGGGGNLFENPSFERGREPWYSIVNPFWGDFEISEERARSGRRSALLRVRSEGSELGTLVHGLVRDFDGVALPERLSGWYRVEAWQRGAQNQYVQVIASVTGAKNLDRPSVPKQIAYVLAGVIDHVVPIPNRPFLFVGEREPVQGEWIHFDFNLQRDYFEQYGVVPAGIDQFRVYLEARFERRDPSSPRHVIADVYFDDLYAGDGSG